MTIHPLRDKSYSYTRTCPECLGFCEELWADERDPDRLVRSGVVCSRCDGDGVIDVYEGDEDV